MKKIHILFVFNAICLTSMMAFLPVAGPIVRKLGMQEWHSGLVVGISGLFWMLFSRFWGKRSDIYGRRIILLYATFGYGIAYVLLALFLQQALKGHWALLFVVPMFIALRAFIGGFYSAIPPVSAAQVADLTTGHERTSAMAVLGAASGIGMILGPLLGGILGKYNLVLPLYFAAALPFFAWLFLALNLKEPKKHVAISANPIKLTDIRLRVPILTSFLASSSVYTAQVCIGFFGLDALKLSTSGAAELSGYAMGVVGVTLIGAQIMVSKLKQIAAFRWLILGAGVSALGFVLVTLWVEPKGLIISYMIMAAGLGMVFPAMQTLAANAVSSKEQGVAAGSVAMAQGLSMVMAPLVSTLLYELSPFLPFLSAALLLLLLLVYVARQPKQSVNETAIGWGGVSLAASVYAFFGGFFAALFARI